MSDRCCAERWATRSTWVVRRLATTHAHVARGPRRGGRPTIEQGAVAGPSLAQVADPSTVNIALPFEVSTHRRTPGAAEPRICNSRFIRRPYLDCRSKTIVVGRQRVRAFLLSGLTHFVEFARPGRLSVSDRTRRQPATIQPRGGSPARVVRRGGLLVTPGANDATTWVVRVEIIFCRCRRSKQVASAITRTIHSYQPTHSLTLPLLPRNQIGVFS